MSSQKLLSAEELAPRLGVRPSTIRRWARKRRIPVLRLSSKVVRYDLAAVIKSFRSTIGGA